MHREMFKSILLGALVLASVAMTSNILFYKSDFENYPTNSAKQVAIAQTRKLTDVIRPNLMLELNSNGEFGQNSNGRIQKVYSLLQQSVFNKLTTYNNKVSRGDNPSYKLIFPAPLTRDALTKVFQFDENSSIPNEVLIDRIELFSSSNGQRITAIFSSPDEKDKLYATVDHMNMNNLKALFTGTKLYPYDRQPLKGKVVYLPDDKTKMHSEVSYYEKLKLEEFLPILFPDPENVFPTRGKTAYTDSARQLEQTNNVIQFVNPSIIRSTEQKQDPLIGSLVWMNSYKLWTDDYIYQGTALKNYRGDGTVTFRMTLGDYMVFNTENYPNWYLSMIELTWRSGELSNYKGTLVNLNLVDNQGDIILDSGKDILNKLSQTSVPVKKIEDMAIGYELNNPQPNDDQSIVATPDWFYKIGGRWYSASRALLPNEKEDPS
ncbi:MAG: hypothetical protein K0Q56_781 [Sporolactobacillus laevolacticus]|jgi:regulatory protein YycH of two-component signal transduction system YycFG|nr:hypothetical protein [Sporolactobacillus laevolacticus]